MSEFWLYRWLDEHEVDDFEAATALLTSPKGIKSLQQELEEVPENMQGVTAPDFMLVAGKALDLSGQLDCRHWECRQKRVDDLLAKSWHYFDQLVVEGVDVNWLRYASEAGDVEGLQRAALHDVRTLLYLRSVGAEDLLVFRTKPYACPIHWRENAMASDLQTVVEGGEEVILRILPEVEIEYEDLEDGRTRFQFNHHVFEHTQFGIVPPEVAPSERREEVVAQVVHGHISHLASDIRLARKLRAPLGTVVPLHKQLLTQASSTEAEVAFELQLPVLEGVPVRTLIELRKDDDAGFRSFRDALRAAIRERNQTKGSAADVADEIRKDVIDPALTKIDRNLRVIEEKLSRKHNITTGVAAMATTCGLLGLSPLAEALVGGCVAAGLATEHKYAEEKSELSTDDLYFLWKATHDHD